MNTTENFLNEISIQYNKKLFSRLKIKASVDVEQVARQIYAVTDSQIEVKEYFFIILLNRANDVLGYTKLSEGGIVGTIVDTRIVFAVALKSLATGIILVHNHPSGNLSPSQTDIQLTRKFRDVGELLDISVLDHIILTIDSYYSFSDNGL